MTVLDWFVVAVYMLGMIGLSVYLGRNQVDEADYYVGGRNLPWWAVGISTMATQSSAISFISIPAFVALREGGGLTWLQYELAVPLAMIAVMVLLIPFFRKLELISVYEYLELRFEPRVRTLMSAVFLISRGLGTGVGIYATAIVLTVCLQIPVWSTILLIGIVTLIYDTIGGMTAVVYSDVIQLIILLFGIGLCIYFSAELAGGMGPMFAAMSPERWAAIDFATGIGSASPSPFWGFLIGGFFLYVSYYGVDQSQVQRELSAPTLTDTKRSLVFNGLARFPLTALYLLLGIAAGGAYYSSAELRAAIPADQPDYLIPVLILQTFPPGIRAIVLAAVLAAAMSSLDSSLNSLSAATMRDFVERYRKPTGKQAIIYSKVTTVIWGAVITGFAFLVGGISETVIEAINKIGSAFYGPILAAFLVGVLSKRANGIGVIAGLIAGVTFNIVLWLAVPTIFFMWWNAFGLIVAVVVTLFASRFGPPPAAEQLQAYTLLGSGALKEERAWLKTYAGLAFYFVFIVAVLIAFQMYAEEQLEF